MAFALTHTPLRIDRISQPYKKNTHKGIDLVDTRGTKAPIYAAADGVVVCASANGKGWDWSYGREVAIDHGNGYYTNYGHCSKVLVKVGQKVKAGTIVAYMGSTGRSTGNHLHFEVWDCGSHKRAFKYRVDPTPYLKAIGKTPESVVRPSYKVGNTYTLQDNMNVRIGHSVSSARVSRSKMTEDARKHCNPDGELMKGTKVTVKDIYKSGASCWVKTPSGWICAYSSSRVYIK